MITLIKLLTLLLIAFLAYDTVNFVLQSHRAFERPTQVELRPKYEAIDITPRIVEPDSVAQDGDIFLGVGFFVFLTGMAGLVMMYFSRYKNAKADDGVSALALRRVQEEPYMTYFYDVSQGMSKDDPRLMKSFSEIELAVEPCSRTPIEGGRSFEGTHEYRRDKVKHFQFEMTTDDENEDEERGFDDIIDFNLLSHNTSLSVQNTTKRDTTLTQTESSMMCDCNTFEQFEERLGAVEHGLKTSMEATREWSKRIEQAEVDLVNLHRQMYTILSKAEFTAPSSDVFSKNVGSSTPTDFYEPTLYKVPDIIVETKKELEQGDLFRKSMSKLSVDDNWNTLMEAELNEKIKELTTNNAEQQPDQSLSTTSTDPTKIKDSLMKKNEEMKEKTRGIFRAMEDAIKATNVRKNKLNVHSHLVTPYKRIHHADNDNSGAAFNLQPSNNKSKCR